jgi:hypothetical protein
MADISNKMLGVIVGIALVISIVGLFSIPNEGFTFIGFGTTGQARINITSSAALNVTQTTIDFGNGTVSQGYPGNCVMSTRDAVRDPNNCFTATVGLKDSPTPFDFDIVNVGNVVLNVTINSTYSSNTSFWGGVSGGGYMLSCAGNGTAASVITGWATPNGTALPCAVYLNATFGQNEFRADINISIPQAAVGVHNDTLTFTGSAA